MREYHGESHIGSKTYKTWINMRDRCNNRNNPDYNLYGGKGIRVCNRWESYLNFKEDMGEAPPDKSIDRLDSNGNYCKENCKWSTIQEQNAVGRRQKRRTNLSGVTGVSYCKRDNKWAARIAVDGRTKTLYYGKFYEEAVAARQAYERFCL